MTPRRPARRGRRGVGDERSQAHQDHRRRRADAARDGELPELRAALAEDPDARRKLEALGELRELVRGHLELATDETDDRKLQAMWRGIDQAIDHEAPRGLWGRISSWLERRRGHLITGVVSAGRSRRWRSSCARTLARGRGRWSTG